MLVHDYDVFAEAIDTTIGDILVGRASPDDSIGYSTVDIILTNAAPEGSYPIERFRPKNSEGPDIFLRSAIAELSTGAKADTKFLIIRYIFVKTTGFLVRSDIIERRLEICKICATVRSFAQADRKALPPPPGHENAETLVQIINGAIAAIQIYPNLSQSIEQYLHILDSELANRLSFNWCIETPSRQKRVGWVQGRQDYSSIGRAYESAKALGIVLVIFDEPGHWLEDDNGPYAHLREAFVPTSINVDDGLTDRVVDAVRRYPLPFDGLVTISDARLASIAAACEVLGLPTEPASAYRIAGDKGVTRRLEAMRSGDPYLVVSSPEELKSTIASASWAPVYPLVVKPTMGWNSDCVAKCNNEIELVAAVTRASARHANSPSKVTTVVVEPYIAGPEVDANIVLLDREVLFFEAEDDFPSTADSEIPTNGANFMETQVLLPSKIPRDELQMLQESLRASIIGQGFRSGVFHCEARVRDSKVQYGEDDNGVLDLVNDTPPSEKSRQPSMYLHEINSRPPGYIESIGCLLTHGVDYYALRLLLSLGSLEHDRIRSSSKSFCRGASFDLGLVILPATRSGIMKTEDAILDLFARNPALRDHVVDYNTAKRRGDFVQGPDSQELWWIGYISVISHEGRKDLLNRIQQIRKEFIYEVE